MIAATITGRLGADPETKSTDKGSLTTLRIASDHYANGKKGTTWVRAVVFGRKGEVIADKFKKGDMIVIAGTMHSDEWQGRDGEKRQTLECVAHDFAFVGGGDRPL